MKRSKFIIAGGVIALCLSLTACEQEEINQHEGQKESLQNYSAKSDDVLFNSVDEFLDYYDALYQEGDVYTLIKQPGGIAIEKESSYVTTNKHDYETKDKIKFARWCDKQLDAGKTLTVGKKADGTYWADIKG